MICIDLPSIRRQYDMANMIRWCQIPQVGGNPLHDHVYVVFFSCEPKKTGPQSEQKDLGKRFFSKHLLLERVLRGFNGIFGCPWKVIFLSPFVSPFVSQPFFLWETRGAPKNTGPTRRFFPGMSVRYLRGAKTGTCKKWCFFLGEKFRPIGCFNCSMYILYIYIYTHMLLDFVWQNW